MKNLLGALFAAAILAAGPASAHFIDGYLAQCTASTASTCTENAGAGYARQPIYFNAAVRGVAPIAAPWVFPPAAAAITARAIYDAPTGGNLAIIIPLASAIPAGQADQGSEAGIVLTFYALTPLQTSDMFSGVFAAATPLGTTGEGSVFTSGLALTATRSSLSPTAAFSNPTYAQAVQVTAFSIQLGVGVSTYTVLGAGTLAAGTIQMPATPYDQELVTINCAVTVTALTLTPQTGGTIAGGSTLATTCGPTAPRQLRYTLATTNWSVVK